MVNVSWVCCCFSPFFPSRQHMIRSDVTGATELVVTVWNWRKHSRNAATGLMGTGLVRVADILAQLPFHPNGLRA